MTDTRMPVAKVIDYILLAEIIVANCYASAVIGEFSIGSMLSACTWLAITFPVTLGFYYVVRWGKGYPVVSVILSLLYLFLNFLIFNFTFHTDIQDGLVVNRYGTTGLEAGVGLAAFYLFIAYRYIRKNPLINWKTHIASYCLLLLTTAAVTAVIGVINYYIVPVDLYQSPILENGLPTFPTNPIN